MLTTAPDVIAANHKLMHGIGLSSGPIRVLRALLDIGPKPMRDLAEYLGCDKSYVTNLVKPLVSRGMATLESDSSDRRMKIVTLTSEGIAAAQRAKRAYETPPAALAKLGAAELRLISDALQAIDDQA